MRILPRGFVFNIKGPSLFSGTASLHFLASYLNSKVFSHLLALISQTISFNGGEVEKIPVEIDNSEVVQRAETNAKACLEISELDYHGSETSWSFRVLPLLDLLHRECVLNETWNRLRHFWLRMTEEMLRLEEENNSMFINAYGFEHELSSRISLNGITLTCNPHYRYDSTKPEALLLADTMREFISYAVGCMFGRYSLDAPGLILANQGETLTDYLTQIPNPTFCADEDNVIPILDGDWFPDDITERFYTFLRTTFGEQHYTENLKFLEEGLGQGKRLDIRKYFLRDFYTDHLKRYKKRPIYWLFSSPKGTFNALIYMHRYRPDTVSIVLNDYLREFQTKLTARQSYLETLSISESAPPSEKTKALREIENLKRDIAELKDYERQTLYPLATQQIEIDLDDGVKVNYPKFGKALKKVPGLS